jgi:hypothetical protein
MAGRRRVVSASEAAAGTEGRGAVTSASFPAGEAGRAGGGAAGAVAGTGRVAKTSPLGRGGEGGGAAGAAGTGAVAEGVGATVNSPRVTGKTAEHTLQRARTPAAGTFAGSTR